MISLVFGFVVSVLIFYIQSTYFGNTKKDQEKMGKVIVNLTQDMANDVNVLYTPGTTREDKVKAIQNLKSKSLDPSKDKMTRILSGQTVVANFFQYGFDLAEGFSTSTTFSERDIFDYAKQILLLGDSDQLPLLTAYIALRFYSAEINKDFILNLLNSYNRYVKQNTSSGVDRDCMRNSKVASIIYLSKKHEHLDISKEYGDYYSKFEETYSTLCATENYKISVAFMWLAAISDIGTTEKEFAKAKDLVAFITKNKDPNSQFVTYLKSSYFSKNKEPDTVSIVERLMSKYPEFKSFIEAVR